MLPSELAEIMSAVRNRRPISDDTVARVCKQPEIDALRSHVTESDAKAVLDLANAGSKQEKVLAFALLQRISNTDVVRDFLIDYWGRISSYDDKFKAMWRLLDNESLPVAVHTAVYEFAKSNEARFVKDSAKWYAGDLATAMKDRMEDKNFPRSKHWVYLFLMRHGVDQGLAEATLREYASDTVGINGIVAKELLTRQAGS